MKPNSKPRQSELVNELQLARDVPQVRMVVELMSLMLEELKHSLISTASDETLVTQGKAQAVGQLLMMLTRRITPIKPPQQTGE